MVFAGKVVHLSLNIKDFAIAAPTPKIDLSIGGLADEACRKPTTFICTNPAFDLPKITGRSGSKPAVHMLQLHIKFFVGVVNSHHPPHIENLLSLVIIQRRV